MFWTTSSETLFDISINSHKSFSESTRHEHRTPFQTNWIQNLFGAHFHYFVNFGLYFLNIYLITYKLSYSHLVHYLFRLKYIILNLNKLINYD